MLSDRHGCVLILQLTHEASDEFLLQPIDGTCLETVVLSIAIPFVVRNGWRKFRSIVCLIIARSMVAWNLNTMAVIFVVAIMVDGR